MHHRAATRVAHLARLASWALALAACGFPRPPDLAQCTTASDCKSPNAPLCVAGSCVAACQANPDCQGVAAMPFCQASSGKCVACLDASACTADQPVCDTTANTCRGCERDDECTSGVCLEAEGRCAAQNEVVFLAEANGADNAACSSTAPCATFAAALAATTPQRYVIHLVGGMYAMSSGVDLTGRRLYIDGTDTVVSAAQGVTFIATAAGPQITLGRMTIGATGGTAVSTSNNGALELANVTVTATATTMGGSLDIRSSKLANVTCSAGGTVHVQGSTVRELDSTNCTLVALANSFFTDVVSPLISADGGNLVIENNVIASTEEFTDPLTILHAISGSRFAFNTVVNFSGVDATATTLSCDGSIDVSSNIFAWHSSATMTTPGCTPHDSLFDELAPANQIGSNQQANASTFFLDLNGKDLHLSAASPARGLGQSGVVDVDIEGNPRPDPPGSHPDVGAYEAP
ncbi:MAG TPA: choice-of-anchor Q domain-containing protein [Kofleriaceae bacterium]|nr:choice-of-anchor Q domain-containing protein [Kofleriaceae bacterium]